MAKERCSSIILVSLSVVTIALKLAKACRGLNDMAERNKTTFVTVGSLTELSCFVSNVSRAAWVLTQDTTPDYISLGSVVIKRRQEDYALNISTVIKDESIHVNSTVYNLIMNKVSEDMEGIYTCKQEGCDIVNVILSVEVPPLLWLQMDNTNISSSFIDVTLNREILITCKAIDGKPEVFLSWTVNGHVQTYGVTSDNIPDGVSSTLQFRPNLNDKNVTCTASGQVTTPSLVTFVNINVLYPPTCHILRHKESLSLYRVTCVCVANPNVSRSSIFVNNDPPIEGNTFLLPADLAADIYCRAENAVGSYETPHMKYYPEVTTAVTNNIPAQPTQEKQNTSSPIMIIIPFTVASLAAVLVTSAWFLFKRITTSGNSRNEDDSADTSIQHYYHLPFETHGVDADPEVKYATSVYQEPNRKNKTLDERTNIESEKVLEMHKEYLEIKDCGACDM